MKTYLFPNFNGGLNKPPVTSGQAINPTVLRGCDYLSKSLFRYWLI